MRTGVHVISKERYTVEQYEHEFGPQRDVEGLEKKRPVIVCIACNQPMHAVLEKHVRNEATWAHNVSKDLHWCPLKESNGGKYALMAPTIQNGIDSEKIRASFFSNWQIHWSHILELAPACNILKLIRFITHADSIRFWAHAGLEEWQIPYIFLANCDFPPGTRKKAFESQSEWIRFRFDANIRRTNDLWCRPVNSWQFMCVYYKYPIHSREPSSDDLLDAAIIKVDSSFLERLTAIDYVPEEKSLKRYFPDEFPSAVSEQALE